MHEVRRIAMNTTRLALSCLALSCLAALAPPACMDAGADEGTLAAEDGALVYGNDDRRQYYEVTDANQRRLADATVVAVYGSALTPVTGGYRLDTSTTYGDDYDLCADEPFRSEPDPGWCSGFAVGTDLIATAGHCVTASSCSSTWFVFGFRMDDASTVRDTVPASDVYRCASVVARSQKNGDDYALVRVDRAIVGKPLLSIRRSGTIPLGAPLVVAGHPAGIPIKVAANATVRNVGPTQYFEANLDTYGGNSGSPVMNATTGVVEGVLVRGNADFVYDSAGACYRSNVCNDTGCPGWEDASKTARFAANVPALQTCGGDAECADASLCNGVELCSFGVCTAGAPVTCGGGQVCNPSNGQCETPACLAASASCSQGNQCCSGTCRRGRCR